MGQYCGKANYSCPPEDQTRVKVVKPPEGVHTRKSEWLGYKNLRNTCYINSGRRSFEKCSKPSQRTMPLWDTWSIFFGFQRTPSVQTSGGS